MTDDTLKELESKIAEFKLLRVEVEGLNQDIDLLIKQAEKPGCGIAMVDLMFWKKGESREAHVHIQTSQLSQQEIAELLLIKMTARRQAIYLQMEAL